MENEVKEPVPKYNYISPEQYIEKERSSEIKHEYYKGEVFAMSGSSLEHNYIFHNVYGNLVTFLKGKNCKPFGSDLRIHIPESGLYTYPDISIICGSPETTDTWTDNITNPAVIIEILSPLTSDYDRGTKFNLYRGIKTLKEYIVIDSSFVSVELFTRRKDNRWNLTEFKQLSDSFVISTIGLSMNLNDIYEDVRNIVREPALKYNYISPEQYLLVERAAEIKHEYHDGKVIVMSGASPAHNDIAYTINRIIAPFLYGKGCKLYGSDFRIHIPEKELFTYPDFSIVCGKAETAEIYTDNLTNPAIIIEILSPSTQDYCRGTKFNLYRSIKTLKEYILIDSSSVSVESFVRQQENSWNLTEFKQLSDSFVISTIGLSMDVKDIYEDIHFKE